MSATTTAPPPTAQQQAAAIQAAGRQQIVSTQAKIEAAAVALWLAYSLHNDSALDDFLGKWMPILAGGQQAIGTITQTYLNQSVQLLSGADNFEPVIVPVEAFTGAILRGGTPPEQVYARPFIQFWSDLKANKPVDVALSSARARLEAVAAADVQLAHTHAARATLQAMPAGAKVTGYRRVIGDDDPCELCVTAASQRYHRAALMPIHNRCHCTVAPIVGTKDLGQRINVVAIADNPPEDGTTELFGRKVVVHEHGEMGPMLTAAGDHFLTENSALRRSAQ